MIGSFRNSCVVFFFKISAAEEFFLKISAAEEFFFKISAAQELFLKISAEEELAFVEGQAWCNTLSRSLGAFSKIFLEVFFYQNIPGNFPHTWFL